VFITILCGRLPRERQLRARRIGLAVALGSRILLLLGITWVMRLQDTLFELVRPWSGKDLILLFGGLFLVYKATKEIYENVENPGEHHAPDTDVAAPAMTAEAVGKLMRAIIMQVVVLDVVFSLDSVITAVGMAEHLEVMVVAVILAVGIMMAFAGPIGDFVQNHASVRVLALAFLVLIGVMLMVEATGGHVSKGYIYSAMGFSLLVEVLNLRRKAREQPPAHG
ncbi:MAG: TerC family protein, partial [Myxococcales bacterium]|nr:TerC family protein [Myxococcales bacterium]